MAGAPGQVYPTSSTMIGNPPTFYDESAAHEQQPQGAYEAWQQQQYHYPPQQHHQQPIQNQYHFVNQGTSQPAHESYFPPVTLNDYPAYFPPQTYDSLADIYIASAGDCTDELQT